MTPADTTPLRALAAPHADLAATPPAAGPLRRGACAALLATGFVVLCVGPALLVGPARWDSSRATKVRSRGQGFA